MTPDNRSKRRCPFESPCRILVTGCRAPAAADLLRWLHHQGHRVTIGDSLRWPAARASRFSETYLRYPSPRRRTDAFHAFIRETMQSHDLVWPCCEEIFWLAQLADVPLFAPPLELLLALHHKNRMAECINAIGHEVRSPESHPLPSGQSVRVPAGWIAKPCHGRFSHRNQVGPAGLSATITSEGWMMQRLVAGREICLHAIASNGDVRELVCYEDPGRRDRGPCLAFRRTNDPVLKDFVRFFCRHHNYTGQLAFDVIIDADDRHWIVDCNPRLTSGMHLVARPHVPCVQLSLARRLRARSRTDTSETVNAPDGLGWADDPGPARLMLITAIEIFLRFPGPIERASTADLQWP